MSERHCTSVMLYAPNQNRKVGLVPSRVSTRSSPRCDEVINCYSL